MSQDSIKSFKMDPSPCEIEFETLIQLEAQNSTVIFSYCAQIAGHWAEPVHRPNEPDPVRVRDSQLFLPPCRQQGQATTHQLTPVAPPFGPSSDLVLMYFLRGFSPLISSSTAARLWEHFDGHGEIFCIFFLNQKVDHDY